MTESTYTFKEILFGLKDEYIKVTNQLNSLEQHLYLKENNIGGTNIFLHQLSEDQDIRIICYLHERKKFMEKILEKIMWKMGLYPNYEVDCIKEEEGNFIFQNNLHLIKKSHQLEFNQAIIDIYNNEFVKHLEPIYCGTGYPGFPYLSIQPHSIYVSEANNISIEYNPNKGLLISSLDKKLSKEKIEESFEMTFSKSKFPTYYQNIIESSQSIEKEIDIIGKINGSKQVNLEIIEEPKRLILKKK